jgi:uncharacterized protein YdhG (YjbR/CyaY superfamily)
LSGLAAADDPHAGYLAACPPAVRERLLAIRAELEARVPGTTRCMAYRMPALRKLRVIVYFAGFKHHIGIYPPVTAPPELVAELAPYAGPNGNLSFPHKAPLPLDLIGRAGAALAAQYGQD